MKNEFLSKDNEWLKRVGTKEAEQRYKQGAPIHILLVEKAKINQPDWLEYIDETVVNNYNKKDTLEDLTEDLYDDWAMYIHDEEVGSSKEYYEAFYFVRRDYMSDEELLMLRKDVSLNSIFVADYANRFWISPNVVCDFFDGFLGYIEEEAKEDGFYDNFSKREMETIAFGKLLEKYDNIDYLRDYYNTMGEGYPF